MKLSFVAFVFLFVVSGCTNNRKVTPVPSSAVIKVTQDDLIAKLKSQGTFESVQTSSINGDFQVVNTTSGDDYFIRDGVVVSSSRIAKKAEKTLLYWRYQFKGKPVHEGIVDELGSSGHVAPLRKLTCDSMGVGVVYDQSTEQVTRVFYYAHP